MKLAWTIAKRYLVAKKSHNMINLISGMSVIGVGIGTMGLIIVLSVFNGFGNLVLELYNSFDPDVRITLIEGKTFLPEEASVSLIRKVKGVEAITFSLEENALLRYNEHQYIATVKGVDESFMKTSKLDDKIVDGDYFLQKDSINFMILGGQIAYSLGLHINDPTHSISVFMPKKGLDASTAMLDPTSAFSQRNISASGIFSVQQDFDSKYVIVPIEFMRELTGIDQGITALEIKFAKDANEQLTMATINKIAGNKFDVKGRLQQHDFLYKILKSEKFAVYLILGFILLIAAFNLFGTLSILILDKRKDITILMNMGSSLKLVQTIFLLEGLLVSVGGALIGMLLGAIICFLQQTFGLLKLNNGGGFLIDAYPVAMEAQDFLIVFAIVFSIGFIASWYTSHQIVKRQIPKQLIK